MKPRRDPRPPCDVAEAEALQRAWAGDVETEDRLGEVRRVAGVDVAYEKGGDRVFAAVVVLDAETLAPVERATHVARATFPYVPGLFSFRELPPLLECFAALDRPPDLVVCDGQGRAHPRRFGLACHLGLLFDLPTIGCAKTRLIGEHATPAAPRGSEAPLLDDGEPIGTVLRTRDGVRPLYVSIGHRVSLTTARDWVLRLSPRFRLPETTRAADQLVGRLRARAGP
ncbi:MAG: deoxyribonuclease V [Myxococcales bacterium]|nr:deoxyribonuclease V [Myxococcales bacterium]